MQVSALKGSIRLEKIRNQTKIAKIETFLGTAAISEEISQVSNGFIPDNFRFDVDVYIS
jgi:hypothetical protein